MDAYYRNFEQLTLDERRKVNWDHPDAFDLPRPPRVKRAEAEKVLSEALLSFLRESRQLSNVRTTRELRLKYRYPTSDDLLREIRQSRGQMKLF